MTGTRFAALERELGDRFIGVEFEGPGHSVLTKDRRESGVRDVLDFLDLRLDGAPPAPLVRDAELESFALLQLAAFPVVEVVVLRTPDRVEVRVDRPLEKAEYALLTAAGRDLFGIVPDVRLVR